MKGYKLHEYRRVAQYTDHIRLLQATWVKLRSPSKHRSASFMSATTIRAVTFSDFLLDLVIFEVIQGFFPSLTRPKVNNVLVEKVIFVYRNQVKRRPDRPYSFFFWRTHFFAHKIGYGKDFSFFGKTYF